VIGDNQIDVAGATFIPSDAAALWESGKTPEIGAMWGLSVIEPVAPKAMRAVYAAAHPPALATLNHSPRREPEPRLSCL